MTPGAEVFRCASRAGSAEEGAGAVRSAGGWGWVSVAGSGAGERGMAAITPEAVMSGCSGSFCGALDISAFGWPSVTRAVRSFRRGDGGVEVGAAVLTTSRFGVGAGAA